LKLRIRKISREERDANPDRSYLAVATGTAKGGFQPAALEYGEVDVLGSIDWFPVDIEE
jgi:hypothetical protein